MNQTDVSDGPAVDETLTDGSLQKDIETAEPTDEIEKLKDEGQVYVL